MEDLTLTFLGVNLVSRVTRDIGRDLYALEGQATSMGSKIGSAWNGVATGLTSIGKIGVMADLVGAAGFAAAVKSVADLDMQLQILQTHAGFTGNIAALKSGMQSLAETTGISAAQLAQADYFISSFGGKWATDAKANLDVLTAAAKTAAMTGADPSATSKALALMLHDFPTQFSTAQQAAGTLNAIIGSGVMTVDQFTTALHTGLFGIAADFHQSVGTIGASIDVLTQTTGDASTSTTGLRNILIQLSKLSPEHVKAFASIGISQQQLADQLNGPNGLIGALEMIKAHLGGVDFATRSTFLSDITSGTRGMPQMSILLDNLPQVLSLQKQITAQAGEFNSMWGSSSKQVAIQFGQLKQSIITLIQDAIEPLMPGVQNLITGATTFVQKLDAWVKSHHDLVVSFAEVITKIAIAAPALALFLGTAMKIVAILSSPLRLVLAVLAGAFLAAHNHMSSLSGVMTDLSNLGNWLVGVFQWLGDTIFNHVIPALTSFFSWMKSSGVLDDLVQGFKVIQSGIAGIFSAHPNAGNTLLGDLKSLIQSFSHWFATTGAHDIVAGLNAVVDMFGMLYSIAKVVLPPILVILDQLSQHTTLLTTLIDLWIASLAIDKVKGFGLAVKGVYDAFKALSALKFVGTGLEFLAGLAGRIPGVGAAAFRFGAWMTNLGGLRGALSSLKGAVVDTFETLYVKALYAGDAIKALGPKMVEVARGGAAILLTGVRLLFGGFVQLVELAGTAFFRIGDGIVWLGTKILSLLPMIGRLVASFARVGITFLLEVVVPMVTGLASTVAGFVAEAIAATIAWIATFWPLILGIALVIALGVAIYEVVTHFKEIGDVVGRAWNALINGARQAGSAVVSFVINKIVQVKDFFAGAGSWLLNAGTQLIQGFLNGIKNKFEEAWNWVTSHVASLVDWVKNHLGIHSPSSVFMEIGRNTMLGFLQGIQAIMPQVQTTLSGITGSAVVNASGNVRITPALNSGATAAANRAASVTASAADQTNSLLAQVVQLLQQLVACAPGDTATRTGIEAQIMALLNGVNTARKRGIRSAVG